MGKIAMCVLTYNHSDTVDEVLNYCIQDYFDCDIDIYYYDGSENTDTEQIVNKYIKMGYSNLYYYNEPDISRRFYMIIMGEGQFKDYEYIWISKDRSFCKKPTLEKIIKAANRDRDVIFLAPSGMVQGKDSVYEDASLFYRDWGWLATSEDVTIFRKSTMFRKCYAGKYPPLFGRHYLLLFTELAELENKSIEVLCENVTIFNSHRSESGWEGQIFKVWEDDWIAANEILPDCYNPYKDDTIRIAASLPWILGTTTRLTELHNKGILTKDKLPEIVVNWDRISDIPFSVVEKIANDRYDEKHELSLFNGVNNEAFTLIKRMTEMVFESTLAKEQIPFNDIRIVFSKELEKTNPNFKELNKLYEGSVEDLFEIIKKYNLDQGDCGKIMQVITLLLGARL